MTTVAKIVIGVGAAVLIGAGIYFGIEDGKAKEAEINKQADEALKEFKAALWNSSNWTKEA